MIKKCTVCQGTINEKHRGWYDHLVPNACSSECFIKMLANIPYGEFINPEAHPSIANFKQSDRNFRSSYEREFDQWLHKHKIVHQYEPYVLTFKDKSRYVPDFWVYSSVFVEVKGIWTSEAKKKFNAVIKEFYGLPIVVIDRAFLNMLKRTSK